MTDDGKQPMQATGPSGAAKPDGVSNTSGGGESGGGGYPNPHDDSNAGRFEGGQSEKDYHGGPGGEDNQAAGT